ncbi:MAG: hypothetical protein KJO07_02175, partial [Deltaproteobacteria bacterium]|nr:hypothetical protein [Deltaproteobacteria bacterium]
VSSLGSDGVERHTGAILGIHNPIEVIPLPTFEIAEIEPAIPVSGCIAGGQTNGRTVTYSESESDTRTRTQELNWDEQWYEAINSTQGGSTSETDGFTITDASAQQTGTVFTWHWKAGVTASTEVNAGLPFLGGSVGVEVSGEAGQQYANYNLTTRTRTVGASYSKTDTESWAYEQSRAYTLSQGGSDAYSVSSENSTIVSFEGMILPGEYGVFYRQATRINLPGLVVAYSACGIPEVVGEATFTDYTWSVDLATGTTCPDFPESELPEAQCFQPPCGNIQ